MGKDKKEKRQSDVNDETEKEESWEEKTKYLCSIAKPLATKKLTKRLYKTIRKGMYQRFTSQSQP